MEKLPKNGNTPLVEVFIFIIGMATVLVVLNLMGYSPPL